MGEINKNSKFGKFIISAVREYNLQRVLEIGSWDGTGSTQCFIEGQQTLESPQLDCIEVVLVRYKELVENTKKWPWIKCHNITSISERFLLHKDFEEIWNSEFCNITASKDIAKSWFDHDIKELAKWEEGYLDNDKKFYDAVFIDGGEFFGYSEYQLIKDRTNFIIIDDCHRAFKTNQVFAELSVDSNWVIVENSNERNGFAAFRRLELINR